MRNFSDKYRILLYNPILVYFFLLVGVSLLAIASSFPLSLAQYPDSGNFVIRQLTFFLIGGIFLFIILLFGMERIRYFRWLIYGVCLSLLLMIFAHDHIPGISFNMVRNVNGATRWLDFDPIPLTLQPSEFMRIALILVSADIIQKHNAKYLTRTTKTDLHLIAKVLAITLPPAVLIYRQPDSGITILILLTAAIMLLGAGIQWRYILTVGGIAIITIGSFLFLVRYHQDFLINGLGIEPYRIARFNGWFDPFGTISGDGHQLSRGLVAIGSGGIFGHGFQGDAIRFPESHTDFIFAVIGKDFGLFGAMGVIILCLLFDFEILNTAALNRGKYNSVVCIGIFASLIGQQFWNIGMCLGMLPISGVTLPFISHGGSSVLSSMIILGLILASFAEGAKIKQTNSNYQEHILYLKTKSYLKDDPKGIRGK